MKKELKGILRKIKEANIEPWNLDFELKYNTKYLDEEGILTEKENSMLMNLKPNPKEIFTEFFGDCLISDIPGKVKKTVDKLLTEGYSPGFIAMEVLFQYSYDKQNDVIEKWLKEDKEKYLEDSVKKIYYYALEKTLKKEVA